MTGMNWRHIKRSNASGSRITLMLLVLSVTLPALCVVWLLIRTSENEELAYKQALKESEARELALLSGQLTLLANARLQAIRQHFDTPGSTLSGLLEAGIADAVTLYSPKPHLPDNGDIPKSRAMSKDLRYLFQTFGSGIAFNHIVDWWKNGALQDLTQQGHRPIEPAFLLLALEYGNPDHAAYAEVESALMEWINRIHSPMPPGQLVFVLSELQRHSPGHEGLQPLLDSASLAHEWTSTITENLPTLWSGFRIMGDMAVVSLDPGHTVALIHCDSLTKRILDSLPPENKPTGRSIRLIRPGKPSLDLDENTAALGFPLEGWRLELISDGEASILPSNRPVLLYIWVGIWVILLSSILVSLVIAMVGKQVNKAAFRNDLVATVSHELKTPIASVRLLVDTLLSQEVPPSPEQVKDYLTLIQNENHRLGALVERFLTFSRMERNRMAFEAQPALTREMLEASVQAFRERFIQNDYTLSIDCANAPLSVFVDRASILTAIGNLLENAYKYSGPDKQIVLRAFLIPRYCVFEVEDNGPGIPINERKRVFQKFYQPGRKLNSHKGGVGLGLSIVTFVARRHKGKVNLISEQGNGCRFQILIPHEDHPHH